VKIGLTTTALLVAVLAWAQGKVSTRDGVYTDAQAARGEASYKKGCASCHGDKMEGSGQMPALAGDEFDMAWVGQTIDDLFERIQNSMPGDKPGTLSRTENADTVAYILKFNKLPAGKNELPSDADSLKKIQIDAVQ
jgi:S-disulfanyl-L-cysteine oxidoreductase SoxD